MTRLWDKGAPLDARVLEYTAGEDYSLDERLVPYDVRASIAHAEMLCAQKLLSEADLRAIRTGLQAIADEHANGQWHIDLNDEDGQTALEKLDLAKEAGPQRAFTRRFQIATAGGIVIDFTAYQGKPILSAVRVRRL